MPGSGSVCIRLPAGTMSPPLLNHAGTRSEVVDSLVVRHRHRNDFEQDITKGPRLFAGPRRCKYNPEVAAAQAILAPLATDSDGRIGTRTPRSSPSTRRAEWSAPAPTCSRAAHAPETVTQEAATAFPDAQIGGGVRRIRCV